MSRRTRDVKREQPVSCDGAAVFFRDAIRAALGRHVAEHGVADTIRLLADLVTDGPAVDAERRVVQLEIAERRRTRRHGASR